MFGLFLSHDDAAAKCLIKATELKGSNDFQGAVASLREAYKHIEKGSLSHPVEVFVRLPFYLQMAGKPEAAWQALCELLRSGYPHQQRTAELLPMDESVIYDKMRLFLDRNGQPLDATVYGLLSHFSWALGLARQNRREELQAHLSTARITEAATKLIARAKRPPLTKQFQALLREEAAQIEKFNAAAFSARVKSLLHID